jgi:hypothetical protein
VGAADAAKDETVAMTSAPQQSPQPELGTPPESGEREIAPIRPLGRPHVIDIVSAVVIAGSLVLAVAIPGLIVSPTAETAPGGKLGLAFGITMVGILIAVLTGIFQYRRTGNWVWFLISATPAFAVFCGGAIFAATKAVA